MLYKLRELGNMLKIILVLLSAILTLKLTLSFVNSQLDIDALERKVGFLEGRLIRVEVMVARGDR